MIIGMMGRIPIHMNIDMLTRTAIRMPTSTDMAIWCIHTLTSTPMRMSTATRTSIRTTQSTTTMICTT